MPSNMPNTLKVFNKFLNSLPNFLLRYPYELEWTHAIHRVYLNCIQLHVLRENIRREKDRESFVSFHCGSFNVGH